MGHNMVRLQRFELKIRPMGFQDTPDTAHMVPGPSGTVVAPCGANWGLVDGETNLSLKVDRPQTPIRVSF